MPRLVNQDINGQLRLGIARSRLGINIADVIQPTREPLQTGSFVKSRSASSSEIPVERKIKGSAAVSRSPTRLF